MMNLMDLFGYFKRNVYRMSDKDIKKAKTEVEKILKLLEKRLVKEVV